MADTQQQAAKEFAEYWKDKGYEKGESQPFWLSLLRDVYGVEHPEQFIEFEDQVHLDNTSFIDGMIPSTKVMIEQKSLGKDLGKAIRQGDGTLLTPFQQAKRYIVELPVDEHPHYVVTCNFAEFWVYDMNKPGGDPEIILLENLPEEYYRLGFLVESKNDHLAREETVSKEAGELVGLLYDAFSKQYEEPDSDSARHSLNVLCVRLVFCLYAENGGIFGHYGMFHDYLEPFDTRQMRRALADLFHILDTPVEQRDRYLADDNPALAAFPYVNGGLFSDEDIEIPPFTDEIRILLLEKASAGFNWSEISPTIFGAVFESTLNPETRRSGGMHYTSVENIHKVIDPLFLTDLRTEFAEICDIAVEKTRNKRLTEFQEKLASLTFLDPACGSGNFLTESYLSLRRLENDVLRERLHGQMSFGLEGMNPIQVSLDQFYGIEINDFAVSVAMTALWIAESQMMQETESIIMQQLTFLPLKSYSNIVEGNALRMDWNDVVPREKLDYIMGNPPFIGHQVRTEAQAADLDLACKDIPKHGKLDYVCAWYNKAVCFTDSTNIHTAFVSTNSITQGEAVAILWRPLFNKGVTIEFAYRSFLWSSEAAEKAAVACVIIGFTCGQPQKEKIIFDSNGLCQKVGHINGYLLAAPNVFVDSRGKALHDFPEMIQGNKPWDGGNLLLSSDERDAMLSHYPQTDEMIKRFVGAYEFINNKLRYCLWLDGISPNKYRDIPEIMERLNKVANVRKNTKTKAVQAQAETPMLFSQIRQPDTDYLLVPQVSSENRRYIPIGFMPSDVIVSNAVYIIPTATLYMYGVMTSNVHMAWMRITAGRLEMRYRYAPAVYNNFPWPTPTDAQRARIEETAQAILDARALYPDSSLADLYDELTMPPELRRAHQANDKAVMEAYGFTKGTEAYSSEAACVAELMKMYQALTSK